MIISDPIDYSGGGLGTKLWLLFAQNAPFLPMQAKNASISSSLPLEKISHEINFLPQTASYDCKTITTKDGTSYKHEIKFSILKERQSVYDLNADLLDKPFCAIIKIDCPERQLLIGDRENPGYLNFEFATGKEPSEQQIYNYVLTLDSLATYRYLTEIIQTTGDFDANDFSANDFS